MIVNGEKLKTAAVFRTMMNVPDCFVINTNKLGHGHGESKLYIASRDEMCAFYGGEKFKAKCFMLKADLLAYMQAIKNEYYEPSQDYTCRENLKTLWTKRLETIEKLDDVIFFDIMDQYQIMGSRGYVNSVDTGYQIIRTIALPLVSYIYVEKVANKKGVLFYWKLFVDFDAIWQRQCEPLVFTYGKGRNESIKAPKDKRDEEKKKNIRQARDGQGKYRDQLLEQCHFCPITMISDERLLIASHIKPWAASNNQEKIYPYNGYMLSPMIDKLFDRGFITFTESRHIVLSEFISPYTWKQIGLKNDTFYKTIPMDDKRIKYLKFHHQSVFKGAYDF